MRLKSPKGEHWPDALREERDAHKEMHSGIRDAQWNWERGLHHAHRKWGSMKDAHCAVPQKV